MCVNMSLILELTVPLDTVRGKNKSGILDDCLQWVLGLMEGKKYVGSSRKKKRQNYINCFKKSLLLQTWALQNAFLARYTTFHWKFVARFWRAAILLETFQDNGKHMSSWSKNATLRIYILIVFNLNWELIAKSIIFPFSPSVNFYQLLLCCTST